MIRKLELILQFYKTFFLPLFLADVWFGKMIIDNKESIIGIIIPFKLFLNIIVLLFLSSYQKNEFYYYHNLGITRKWMLVYAGVIDSIIFSLFIFVIIKFK